MVAVNKGFLRGAALPNKSSFDYLAKKIAGSADTAFLFGIGDFDWTAYDEYEIHLVDVIPSTNAVNLQFQISRDGGASFVSTATYGNTQLSFAGAASSVTTNSGQTSNILTAATISNANPLHVILILKNPSNPNSLKTMVTRDLVYLTNAGVLAGGISIHDETGTGAYNGIRIAVSTGTIASGRAYAYGVRRDK